ncbi:hypothetical protein MGSAQ_002558, partial [marine sediment metagenome]
IANGRLVPPSRLCLVNLAAPSTNVRSGDAARQRSTRIDRPLWAETYAGSEE